MNLKRILTSVISVFAAISMAVVPAVALQAGYSDYGKSDTKTVSADADTILTIGNGSYSVTINIPVGALPADVTEVSCDARLLDANSDEVKGYLDAATRQASYANTLQVLDINLYDQDGNSIKQLNGYVSVSIPLLNSDYDTVIRLDDGGYEVLKSSVSNGFITFQTNHFSKFVLAKSMNTDSGSQNTNSDSQNTNPKTGDNVGITLMIVGLIAIAACGIGFGAFKFKKSK